MPDPESATATATRTPTGAGDAQRLEVGQPGELRQAMARAIVRPEANTTFATDRYEV